MEHLLAPLPTRGRTCGEDIEHNRVKIVYTKENHRKYGGFCSFGGDVKYLTLMDAGSIWMIGMPLTLILGLIFKVDIWYVYAAHIAIELFKLPLGQRRLRSRKWYHNVTEAVSSVENN